MCPFFRSKHDIVMKRALAYKSNCVVWWNGSNSLARWRLAVTRFARCCVFGGLHHISRCISRVCDGVGPTRSTSSDEPASTSRPQTSSGLMHARSSFELMPPASSSKSINFQTPSGDGSGRRQSVLFEDETITLDQFLAECNRSPKSRVFNIQCFRRHINVEI